MAAVQTVTLDEHDGAFTIVVDGDLDMAAVEVFDPAILDAIPGGTELVVDMTAAGFVDSTGIGLLVDLVRQAGSVRLLNPPRRARRLIEVSGLQDVLTIADPPPTADA